MVGSEKRKDRPVLPVAVGEPLHGNAQAVSTWHWLVEPHAAEGLMRQNRFAGQSTEKVPIARDADAVLEGVLLQPDLSEDSGIGIGTWCPPRDRDFARLRIRLRLRRPCPRIAEFADQGELAPPDRRDAQDSGNGLVPCPRQPPFATKFLSFHCACAPFLKRVRLAWASPFT